jgi:hypothetical protein
MTAVAGHFDDSGLASKMTAVGHGVTAVQRQPRWTSGGAECLELCGARRGGRVSGEDDTARADLAYATRHQAPDGERPTAATRVARARAG